VLKVRAEANLREGVKTPDPRGGRGGGGGGRFIGESRSKSIGLDPGVRIQGLEGPAERDARASRG
jgi:hypothetical protein